MSQSLKESVISYNKGDNTAFDQIYAKIYRPLFVSAKIYLKNEEDAQDAVQDACILIMRDMKNIKGPGSAMAWCQTIIRNVCLNKLRKNKDVNLDEDSEYIMNNIKETDKDAIPEDAFMGKEKSSIILNLVALLPLAQREASLLHYVHGHSVTEVAELTNSTTGTVKSRLNCFL